MERIAIVIPAFNAAQTIAQLCREIGETCPGATIIVVDDGSSDHTASIAAAAGAIVIRHNRNRGKGAALKTGFGRVLEDDFVGLVTLDADLQHDPREITSLIDAALKSENPSCTVAVGTRPLDPTMPFPRKVSNSLSSFVASIFSTVRLSDSQSGFRFIPTRLLREIDLSSDKYDLEPELLIRAARAGYSIRSVPVRTIYNDSRSFINPAADLFRFLKMITKSLFW